MVWSVTNGQIVAILARSIQFEASGRSDRYRTRCSCERAWRRPGRWGQGRGQAQWLHSPHQVGGEELTGKGTAQIRGPASKATFRLDWSS
eukprot:SAG31_NODE_20869_length_563_cov_2.329741_2_plen_89_part_01